MAQAEADGCQREFCRFFAESVDDINELCLTRKDDILSRLKSLTKWLTHDENRSSLSSCCIRNVVQLSESCEPSFDSRNSPSTSLFTECLRVMRNACAGCSKNQAEFTKNTDLLRLMKVFKSAIGKVEESENVLVLLRCGMQFLGNSCASNENVSKSVWKLISTFICALLAVDDFKLTCYSCMLLHSVTFASHSVLRELCSQPNGIHAVDILLKKLHDHNIEFGLFLLQHLLLHSDDLSLIWSEIHDQQRCVLLEIAVSQMQPGNTNNNKRLISESVIDFLAVQFCSGSEQILLLNQKCLHDSPVVQCLLLECLCLATAEIYPHLQHNSTLLSSSLDLLTSLHEIGKQGNSVFTAASKPSEETLHSDHPAFSLKKNLMRLICNLCHSNRPHQDLVREKGALGVILENTKIDQNNPYITQWSVLAIRNVCEGNEENQKFIQQMTLQGLAHKADDLRAMGVNAEVSDGRITVQSVKK